MIMIVNETQRGLRRGFVGSSRCHFLIIDVASTTMNQRVVVERLAPVSPGLLLRLRGWLSFGGGGSIWSNRRCSNQSSWSRESRWQRCGLSCRTIDTSGSCSSGGSLASFGTMRAAAVKFRGRMRGKVIDAIEVRVRSRRGRPSALATTQLIRTRTARCVEVARFARSRRNGSGDLAKMICVCLTEKRRLHKGE